jgi:serine acetyltransferase
MDILAGVTEGTEGVTEAQAMDGAETGSEELGTVRGMSFEDAKAIQDVLPKSEYSLWQLIWSDYGAQYRYKRESTRTQALMFLPRMLTNASLHATALIRLCTETPIWMWWFWRRMAHILIASEVLPYCRFGPGLRCPHPVSVNVGYVVAGRDVVLQHGISVSSVTTNWRSGENPGLVQMGDGVVVYTGAVIAGRVTIGDGAMLGANAVVTKDVPAHTIFARGRTRPLTDVERYKP